ncbi:MAG: hypothetical protein CL489_08890 [Acidobacteria bacterium]|nr:hypothetical protein [Acidobacteriota bacterium]|tara:strand:- start:45318 stop:46271 length:954 start_codon:yes stop_codon:yes gene_type:complete
MNKFIMLTVGASSSGKTSDVLSRFKKEIKSGEVVNVNRDDIRFGLFTDGERDWTRYKFNKKNEALVTTEQDERIQKAIDNEQSIIISDTNLNPKIRQKFYELAQKHDYDIFEYNYHVSWDELVKRNAQRYGGVNESLLWSMFKRMCRYTCIYPSKKEQFQFESYKEEPTLDSTIIVDMDGTTCDMTGIRKPYEWHKVSQDRPRHEIIDMVRGLAMTTGHVTFLSGRDGQCYDDTWDYIDTHIMTDDMKRLDIKWDLYMREEGDQRKDDIVKYELYDEFIRGRFNVSAVFDDRKSVIRMWSAIGLPNIVDVGSYNVEF